MFVLLLLLLVQRYVRQLAIVNIYEVSNLIFSELSMEGAINERIKFLLETRAKNNKAAFARLAGVSGQAIADIVEGRKGNPSFSVVQNILNNYPDLNAEWLMLGTGQMIKGQQPEGAGLTSGAAVVAESETLLKLAVTEEKLRATQEQLEEKKQENGRLWEMLGKPLSSLEAALRNLFPHASTQGATLSMAA